MPSARYSSAKPSPTGKPKAATFGKATPLDHDALDALDFASRDYPDSEIGYSDDAPRLTDEQLAEFEPAAFRIVAKR